MEDLSIIKAFGLAVKIRRTRLQMSQETLANETGMARSFISAVERGTTKASIDSVWKIAKALDCLPSKLWLDAESMHEK